MKEMQFFSLSTSNIEIWKNQDTANINEAKSRDEIISKDKNRKIDYEEEEYVFTEDLYPETNILST